MKVSMVFLILLVCFSCEKWDPKFIRKLENTVLNVNKVVLQNATFDGRDSVLNFKKAFLDFEKAENKESPRIGTLSIDEKKSSFYYSLNNTQTLLTNGEISVNNLFIQSLLPRFYNPTNNIVASFYLDGEAILDLEQNFFRGKVIFLKTNPQKTIQILIYFD